MGRKAGGKNFGNYLNTQALPIEVTEEEKDSLADIFTCIPKDFIGVQDMINSSGLSYETCIKIIREIKSVSDIFNISGYVHRTDDFLYIPRKFKISEGGKEKCQS